MRHADFCQIQAEAESRRVDTSLPQDVRDCSAESVEPCKEVTARKDWAPDFLDELA